MNWTYPEQLMREQNPAGVADLLAKLEQEAGGPPLEGTRFLFDGHEMLATSREIENAMDAGGTLYSGFQSLQQFWREAARYDAIARRGVSVSVFGTESPDTSGLHVASPQVVRIEQSRNRLENQWFLVATGPRQMAFVGYELTRGAPTAHRRLRDPSRVFAGFATEDRRVVGSLASYLAGVITRYGETIRVEEAAIEALREAEVILALTDDGRDPAAEATRAVAAELARRSGATLLLYDASAESYLTDPYPYPDVIGPGRMLRPEDVSQLGRGYLARQMRAAAEAGADALAWLPQRHGARGMAEAVERFAVGAVVLPSRWEHPSLMQRLRGHALDRYRSALDVPIVLSTEDRRAVLDVAGRRERASVG